MNRASMLIPLWTALLATATPTARGEDRLDAYYPEGPIIVGEAILFAEMHADRVVRWSGEEASTFYESAGCGPTAIAPYQDGYAVLCHIADEVHLVSADGRLKKRIKKDLGGRRFVNPNDATPDGEGGVYFTASGVFSARAPAQGAVLYLDAAGEVRRLADKLHYANGVYFDAAQRLLFVSEHLGRRILSYPALAPGRLGRPAVFANLADETSNGREGYALTGPDGLETDAAGNLYAAIYGAGALLVLSPQGEVLARRETPEALITNVALTRDGRMLVVTGSEFSRVKPFPGAVRKIPNPLHAE